MSAWLRRNLFPDWASGLATVLILGVGASLLSGAFGWLVLHAETVPDPEVCRALDGSGACWGVIVEKWRLILFGRYPVQEHWRPAVAIVVLLAALAATALTRLRMRWMLLAWGVAFLVFLLLMKGGAFGLTPVETERWGGLALTVLLATAGMGGAFPLGVLLALGRRSELPAIRALCTSYVEVVRGIPLVPTLFMAAFVFPLFLPLAWGSDVLLRVLLAIVLFAAAYLAEVVRGGLQSVSAGQGEAAAALGLGYWQVQRHILLPQALAAALPALVSTAIGIFKDVSLVTVVSLYELTGSLTLALAGDAQWRPFYLEGYLFVGLVYWLGCFGLSQLGLLLERRLALPK